MTAREPADLVSQVLENAYRPAIVAEARLMLNRKGLWQFLDPKLTVADMLERTDLGRYYFPHG